MIGAKNNVNVNSRTIGRARGGLHTDRPVMLSEYEELWYSYYGDNFLDPTGHSGEYLTNDGTTLSWSAITNMPSIDITYLALKTLKTAGTLKKGAIYKITDRYNYQSGGSVGVPNLSYLGDDRGLIYIKALEVNLLSKEVIRRMSCPTNYSTTGTLKGVWNIGKTAAINDIMIWGAKVWKNVTGVIGTATNDSVLSAAWQLQTKVLNTGNVYIDKQFSAIYDFDNDWFEQQWDGAGNKFGINFYTNSNNYLYNFNLCDITDWNLETSGGLFFNNTCLGIYNNINTIIHNCKNTGVINECTNDGEIMYISSIIQDITINNGGAFIYDTLLKPSSNLPFEIDITGLTSIPFHSDYITEITLISSNVTETITSFSSISSADRKIKYNIEAGLTVTFIHGSGALQPHCEGTISAVLSGDNGDWIEFEKSPLNIIRQSNIGTY